MEDYEPDRIERDGSGSVTITLGDLLGLDVPSGAGAVKLSFSTANRSHVFIQCRASEEESGTLPQHDSQSKPFSS